MRRRQAVAALGSVGLAGCLRLTSDPNASTETDGSSGAASTTPSGGATDGSESGLFASRADAIEHAGGFANSDDVSTVEPYAGGGPELIQHGGGWGSSSGSGDGGGIYTSSDIKFEPISNDGVAFGGDANRSLRVRNVTTGSTATFHPDDATSTHRVTEWDIDPETEAVPPVSIGVDVGDGGEHTSLPGTWTGAEDIFRTQTFGMYVVELLEDSTRIGGTAGAVYGHRYHWSARQTRDALYVTRQPSVKENWYATLLVGQNPFDPQAKQMAEHRPEDGVFRVDLTQLDLDSGQYQWSLFIRDERPAERDPAIELSPRNVSLIVA